MPGGTGRKLRALEQHDIGPAEPGKVVEGGNTDNAAADHDNAGMALHRFYSVTRDEFDRRRPPDGQNLAGAVREIRTLSDAAHSGSDIE